MRRVLPVLVLLVSLAAVPAAAAHAKAVRSQATHSVRGDFNGDGIADLAMGAPDRNNLEGEVDVVYGNATKGLTLTGSNLLPGELQSEFGYALAAGDFNGDGFSDLAVSERAYPNQGYQGKVVVIYGTKHGLDLGDDQELTQGGGLPGTAQNDAQVGAALAAGDFNGDGVDDLAVGAPGETVSGIPNAGRVFLLYGIKGSRATGGLRGKVKAFDENSFGIPGSLTQEQFGAPLAAADFGKSSADDLAIGKPSAKVGTTTAAGQVIVLYGGTHGLSTKGAQLFALGQGGVPGSLKGQETPQFGIALAGGNFGRSSQSDLAVGADGYDFAIKQQNVGAVVVLYGSSSGLTKAGSQFWNENTPGIPQSASSRDDFGSALAAGNMGNGPQDDLAVGANEKTIAGIKETGAVFVLYGSASGLSGAKAQFLWEGSPGVPTDPMARDQFGSGALYVANFGKGQAADLAIGVPFKAVGSASLAGVVDVMYGSASGITAQGAQIFRHGGGSFSGAPGSGDELGFSLA